jgi:hypothetical protein
MNGSQHFYQIAFRKTSFSGATIAKRIHWSQLIQKRIASCKPSARSCSAA